MQAAQQILLANGHTEGDIGMSLCSICEFDPNDPAAVDEAFGGVISMQESNWQNEESQNFVAYVEARCTA